MFVGQPTTEELKKLEELTNQFNEILSNEVLLKEQSNYTEEELQALDVNINRKWKSLAGITRAQEEIFKGINARYIKSLNGDKERLLADFKNLFETETTKEYLDELWQASYFTELTSNRGTTEEEISTSYLNQIIEEAEVLINAWRYLKFENEELVQIIQEQLDKIYPGALVVFENDIEPKTTDKDLPVQFIKAHNMSVSNSKIAHNMQSIGVNLAEESLDGQISLILNPVTVGTYKEKGQVIDCVSKIAFYTLEDDKNNVSYNRNKIKNYDKDVLDTICTLYEVGNRVITISQIYKTMNGNSSHSPTKAQSDKILNSVRKLSSIKIWLNVTEELQHLHYSFDDERLAKGEIEGNMLSCTLMKVTAVNGKEAVAIKVHELPLLFSYSKAKRQIITFKTELLNLPINETEALTAIKFYLLTRIAAMKNGVTDNPGHKIKYDTIYQEAGEERPTDKMLNKRGRDLIKRMLDHWSSEAGGNFIKGYTEYKEGKTIIGVSLKF